jgi:hypothetical protein
MAEALWEIASMAEAFGDDRGTTVIFRDGEQRGGAFRDRAGTANTLWDWSMMTGAFHEATGAVGAFQEGGGLWQCRKLIDLAL